jgi:hypothetical protein
MLNPALTSLLLSSAAYGHKKVVGSGMPFEYAFLVAPLVLHRGTREELPSNINSHITKWISERPVLQAAFAPRAKGLVPFVLEGLRYGLASGQLSLEPDGRLIGSSRRTTALNLDSELAALTRSSALVGRWLAKAERPSTIFALFGVTP